MNRPDVVAHREQWAAWLAENPESEEAVYIREMDASQKRGNGAWWNDPVQKGNMFFSVADNLRYNRRNS